jgi:ribosomal protein S18 acetylase RimI-like enzyme
MAISTSISRFAAYCSRNGLSATFRRAGLAARRALFSNRNVLFYCNLATQMAPPADLPSFMKLERKKSFTDLSPDDLQAMISFWNPKLARRNMKERFDKGALLWLMKSQGGLAGYGWALQGSTMEPHYFPLGQQDVHLFDFHVFPQYRGRGVNPFLVRCILHRSAADGGTRAFIEAAEWNQAQLSSLGKTPFHRFGRARKWTVFGRTIVCWAGGETYQQQRTDIRERLSSAAPSKNVRSNTLNDSIL